MVLRGSGDVASELEEPLIFNRWGDLRVRARTEVLGDHLQGSQQNAGDVLTLVVATEVSS
ncbi:MAG: hypothetical protein EA388_11680 [Nitriliruptor sp.]|nr:MAG: hypothetical protein EA388_11680 [Nitriliruptor sp.]